MRRRRGPLIKSPRSVARRGEALTGRARPRIVSGTINKETEG